MVVRYNYVVGNEASELPDAEIDRLIVRLLQGLVPGADDGPAAPAAPAAAASAAPARAGQGAAAPEVAALAASAAAGAAPVVSASEARALVELAAAHGIAQGELAGLLGLEKSTVSRLAAGLERKGWVRRGRDDGDLRYVRLYLTDDGRAVARRVWQAWQTRQARILAGLTADERAGLASGLRGLIRGLAAEARMAGQHARPSPGRPGAR